MVRHAPQLVRGVVLVDPVCFMLNEAHVAYNFLYRRPTRWTEWIMHAFAARELHVAHVLTRCFDWHVRLTAVRARELACR
jgi:hypothetical protein